MTGKTSERLWFEHTAQSKQAAFRLFCFPYAGGNVQVFRRWTRHFPSEMDLCLVHLPGHGRRLGEPPVVRLAALIERLAGLIDPELERPFAFYGHSMGALISFELARELFRRHGRGPSYLFLSGHRAPHLPSSAPLAYSFPDEQFIANLKRLDGTPPELFENPELRQIFLPVLRADFKLVNTYEYRSGIPLPCPLSIYGGLQDKDVPVESLRAWAQHTVATCNVRLFQGGHFFIHDSRSEFIPTLCNDVLRSIQNAHHKQR